MKRLLGILMIIVAYGAAYGQQSLKYDEEVLKHYNEGIAFYDAANYNEANRSFRKALATNKVLPTNLSYYFAETLYHLGQYQNSKNFIQKYMSLAGYGGDFYEQAEYLVELLDGKFNEITNCKRCNVFGYRLIPCETCESSGLEIAACHQCKGMGNSLCPKCTGKGVVVTVDAFNQSHYAGCDRCDGAGYVPCELCEGDKIVTRTCLICLGAKVRASTTVCNHQDHQEELSEKKKLK